MSNVVDLPMVTTLDHPAEFALRKASEADLKSAAVIGWKKDGGFYFCSSMSDAAEVVFLCEMAKTKLLKIVDEAMP